MTSGQTAGLVERMRNVAGRHPGADTNCLVLQAADALDAKDARIKELEALVELADKAIYGKDDAYVMVCDDCAGKYYDARAALYAEGGKP